jgi:hypothetical protein
LSGDLPVFNDASESDNNESIRKFIQKIINGHSHLQENNSGIKEKPLFKEIIKQLENSNDKKENLLAAKLKAVQSIYTPLAKNSKTVASFKGEEIKGNNKKEVLIKINAKYDTEIAALDNTAQTTASTKQSELKKINEAEKEDLNNITLNIKSAKNYNVKDVREFGSVIEKEFKEGLLSREERDDIIGLVRGVSTKEEAESFRALELAHKLGTEENQIKARYQAKRDDLNSKPTQQAKNTQQTQLDVEIEEIENKRKEDLKDLLWQKVDKENTNSPFWTEEKSKKPYVISYGIGNQLNENTYEKALSKIKVKYDAKIAEAKAKAKAQQSNNNKSQITELESQRKEDLSKTTSINAKSNSEVNESSTSEAEKKALEAGKQTVIKFGKRKKC